MSGTPNTCSDYAELHLHTAYSFLDGASLPEELVGKAVELGYRWLAITDHDGLYGAMEFAQFCRSANIAPITGAELTLTDDSHLTLLVETARGYSNLCRLITAAHATAQDRQPRLDPQLLATHTDGLILLTGCRQGRLSRLVDQGDLATAECQLRQYIEWFGQKNVAVELQNNLVFGDTQRIRQLTTLAKRVDVPIVATGNVHYHDRTRSRLQDVLVAIRQRTTLDGCHRERRPNAEFSLPSRDVITRRWRDFPEAIQTTLLLAERCAAFDLTRDLQYNFPNNETGTDESSDEMLARVCWEAFPKRYPPDDGQAQTALTTELRLIAHHKLSGFFLIYRDLLQLAYEVADEIREGERAAASGLPPGRGRGSAVSSVVCYLIGLTPVDPLAHKLFLGRFLNEEMASVPDIDLDFPREIRARLIERVYERYPDRAGLVCAFATYKLRSAVRDVGKVLGLPAADLDQIARLSDSRSATALGEELARLPAFSHRMTAPPWTHLVELAGQLANFPRHITQHVGGMVITAGPITDIVPVQPATMPGRWLIQWDKDACDDARFIKLDFLALGMLSLVDECVCLISARHGSFDLSKIDHNDPAVYDMICEGDTIGTFQVESRAQIQMLPRTRPRTLEDLVVQVAIVRPGPIVGGAVKPYVTYRKQAQFLGHIEPIYDHPLLEEVLHETHGVILFQEQVIKVAMVLASFSAGQADLLRRAMSRKRSREAIERLWEQFRAGTQRNGVDLTTARRVFDKLLGFAEYGFPKAHAAAFALLTYQSCWLKRYYPAEFMCALLNNQPMGFYPPHVLVNDAKRHGLRILAPDVNASAVQCVVEGKNGIRIGFGYVTGLDQVSAQRIVQERTLTGEYCSLADLVRRLPLTPEIVEKLILIGALDRFGLERRTMLWQLGLFTHARRVGGQRNDKQYPNQQIPLPLPVEQDNVELRPLGPWEQMTANYAVLGLSPTYHPLWLVRAKLPTHYVTTTDLPHLPSGCLVRLAGLVVCRQRPETARGTTFLLLEDERGLANVIVSRELYSAKRVVIRGESFIVATGHLRKDGEVINLVAVDIEPLDIAQIAATDVQQKDEVSETVVLSPASHNYH